MRARHRAASLLLAGVLALAAGAAPAHAQTEQWKMQAATQAGEIAFQIMKEFTDSIGPLTGGRLQVELLPVGSVVQYSETLDAVGTGILDGQVTAPVYFSGKNPAFALLGDLIAAYNHTEEMFLFLRRGGGDGLLRELYAGVRRALHRRRRDRQGSPRFHDPAPWRGRSGWHQDPGS